MKLILKKDFSINPNVRDFYKLCIRDGEFVDSIDFEAIISGPHYILRAKGTPIGENFLGVVHDGSEANKKLYEAALKEAESYKTRFRATLENLCEPEEADVLK